MSKKTFFFPHDANARNDEKLLAVRMKHGMEGYGVYFALIEKLLESTDYILLKDYNTIAFELRVGAEIVKSIVEKFGLFQFTECGKLFYSETLKNRMTPLENIRDQRREAGKKSAAKRWGKHKKVTTVTTKDNESVTSVTPKSNRVEDSRVNIDTNVSIQREVVLSNGDKKILTESLFTPMQELLADKIYIQMFSNNNYITEEQTEDYVKNFFVHLQGKQITHKTKKDTIDHFSNWISIQLEKVSSKKQKAIHAIANHDNNQVYEQF